MSDEVKLTFLVSLSVVLTVGTVLLLLYKDNERRHSKKESNPSLVFFSSFSIIVTVVSIVVTLFSLFHDGDNPPPSKTPLVETSSPSASAPLETPAPSNPPSTPRPTPQKIDNLSTVVIADMSDQGFDTGLGTEHFSIQPSVSDNFGNTYDIAGVFSWQEFYAVNGYVVFYVADYTKLKGQLVAIENQRPADNAYVVMYLDDEEKARYTGIEKTTLPIDFELDLTDYNFLRIETNSQEIMYVNFRFYY